MFDNSIKTFTLNEMKGIAHYLWRPAYPPLVHIHLAKGAAERAFLWRGLKTIASSVEYSLSLRLYLLAMSLVIVDLPVPLPPPIQ